ncbi:MAG TPA: hypothetical protein VFK05_20430 [Polyangiaceae bacterium]|nr:hypothetical protein [Polyangiaceae bacterium]
MLNPSTTTCTALAISSAWNDLGVSSTPTSNCAKTGTPTASPPTWTDSNKFCSASAAGSGCSAGNVCVPTAPGSACLLASGSQECPATFPVKRALYTAYNDSRVCSCSCVGHGGACDNVFLNVSGASSGCTNSTALSGNGGLCLTNGTSNSQLGYFFSGSATPPTSCDATNVVTGTLTPTGPQTLCCQ